MIRQILTLSAVALFCLAAPLRADTMGNAYAPDEIARIDILPGWRMTNGNHMAALRIRLADGWKTYWRAPGEAGIPPGFDWSGSSNMQAVTLHWPAPQVFVSNGMRTVGYSHELVLPFEIVPADSDAPITVKGRVALGVCFDVCMPMQAEFTASLSIGGTRGGAIGHALNARPDRADEAGLRRASCDVEPIGDGLRITAELDLPLVGTDEFVVIEAPDPDVWVSEAMVARQGQLLTASADMVPPSAAPFALSRSDLTITVLAQGRAVEISGCHAP